MLRILKNRERKWCCKNKKMKPPLSQIKINRLILVVNFITKEFKVYYIGDVCGGSDRWFSDRSEKTVSSNSILCVFSHRLD